jgi:hypothetical protein
MDGRPVVIVEIDALLLGLEEICWCPFADTTISSHPMGACLFLENIKTSQMEESTLVVPV